MYIGFVIFFRSVESGTERLTPLPFHFPPEISFEINKFTQTYAPPTFRAPHPHRFLQTCLGRKLCNPSRSSGIVYDARELNILYRMAYLPWCIIVWAEGEVQ